MSVHSCCLLNRMIYLCSGCFANSFYWLSKKRFSHQLRGLVYVYILLMCKTEVARSLYFSWKDITKSYMNIHLNIIFLLPDLSALSEHSQ